jgi:predicted peroxiredoxin
VRRSTRARKSCCGSHRRASGSAHAATPTGSGADKDPPAERLHAQFIEKGGQFYVCPICFKERDLNADGLVENAELKGASPLMDFAGDGAVTFTY